MHRQFLLDLGICQRGVGMYVGTFHASLKAPVQLVICVELHSLSVSASLEEAGSAAVSALDLGYHLAYQEICQQRWFVCLSRPFVRP